MPILRGSASLPEVEGIGSHAQFWALLFYSPPATTGTQEKIVVRMTGKSAGLRIQATGPSGQTLAPSWGPQYHGGSTWDRPGQEWGTGWTFPTPGCWRIEAQRGKARGEIDLQVATKGTVPPPFTISNLALTIRQGRQSTNLRRGPITFTLSATLANAPPERLSASLTLRHAGRRFLQTDLLPAPDSTRAAFRATGTIRLHTPGQFRAIATLRERTARVTVQASFTVR